MDAAKACTLECFPEMILIEILSYLNVKELVRSGRVCKRWRVLVKDQRLWRTVDLSTWKRGPGSNTMRRSGKISLSSSTESSSSFRSSDIPSLTVRWSKYCSPFVNPTLCFYITCEQDPKVTSRVLWTLLRQYLGRGLCFLHLRGLLLSARGRSSLTEPWLQALSKKCPRLRRLKLSFTYLRGQRSCSLPPSLQILELHSCEIPSAFFTQNPSGAAQPDPKESKGNAHSTSSSSCGPGIETLILDNVPSFTDRHLQSLSSWERLHRLGLINLVRVTVAGVKGCAPPGPHALTRLTHLELESSSRQQMAALGLAEDGWPGLQRLALGGREVVPGLLRLNRLPGLRWLQVRNCRVAETMLLRVLRPTLKELQTLEFLQVEFVIEGELDDVERSDNNPMPSLRRALANLLPNCSVLFTQCTVTVNPD